MQRLIHERAERLIWPIIAFGSGVLLAWMLIIVVVYFIVNPNWGAAGDGSLWDAMQGVSAAAAFALTVGGALVIFVQLNAALAGLNLDIYNHAFERMMSKENVEARRWIYRELPNDFNEGLQYLETHPEGLEHIKLVLNSFDYLGFLVREGWAPSDSVIRWVSPFVVKTWDKIEPYVQREIKRRTNEPDYYDAACYLAERCREWRIEMKYLPDEKKEVAVENRDYAVTL